MRKAVISLESDREVWRAPRSLGSDLGSVLGSGWAVYQSTSPVSSDGDGSGVPPDVLREVGDAEIYVGWGVPGEVFAAGDTLRWVHTATGGVGGSLSTALLQSGARLTNSAGIHAEPMADWVLTAIGFCARGFHAAVEAQRQGRWAKDDFTNGSVPVRELNQLHVVIAGLGGVGQAVSRRCLAMGMQVSGTRRNPRSPVPEGVFVRGIEELPELVRSADVLVVAAPHTRETEGLVSAELLASLPDGAYVINVGRGSMVDEDALVSHLSRLGGCVLDVCAIEPLPTDHAFWTHPRVFLTPHVSAVSNRFWERESSLILENARRYLDGRDLINLVDPERGY